MTVKIEKRKRTSYSCEVQPAVFVHQLAKEFLAVDGHLSRLLNSKLLHLCGKYTRRKFKKPKTLVYFSKELSVNKHEHTQRLNAVIFVLLQ